MQIIRCEKDKEIKTYCSLIDYDDKLYFVHSYNKLLDITNGEFEDYLKTNNYTISVVAIEDLETINNHYHVAFTYEQLIEQFISLKKNLFTELFFLYSIIGLEHVDPKQNHIQRSKIAHQLFGQVHQANILNQPEVTKTNLQKAFIYSDNLDEDGNISNGEKLDFYTFSNIYEDEISDIITFGCKQSFRDVMYNTKCSGVITNEFLFKTLKRNEFSERVSLFYRYEQGENPKSIQKKVTIAERKWKIDFLLNPNFLLKKQNAKNA